MDTEGSLAGEALQRSDDGAAPAGLPREPNFSLAIPAGIAAAIAGAIIWAMFVYLTNYELGLIAVAVGALVGVAIRRVGNGTDIRFSLLGAACAAFGWLLGTLLCDIGFLAREMGRPFLEVTGMLDLSQMASLTSAVFEPLDLLFLAIAIWEGWKLSVHRSQ